MKLLWKWVTVCVTCLAWLLVSGWYGYRWVAQCMADVTCREYEGIWILPALGFLIYEGPKLVLVLAGILVVEWIIFFTLQRAKRQFEAS